MFLHARIRHAEDAVQAGLLCAHHDKNRHVNGPPNQAIRRFLPPCHPGFNSPCAARGRTPRTSGREQTWAPKQESARIGLSRPSGELSELPSANVASFPSVRFCTDHFRWCNVRAGFGFGGAGFYLRFPDEVTPPDAAPPGFCVLRSESMKMKSSGGAAQINCVP